MAYVYDEPLYEKKLHLLEYLLQQNNIEQIENRLQIIFKNEECVENPFLFVCEKNILAIVKLFVKYKFQIISLYSNTFHFHLQDFSFFLYQSLFFYNHFCFTFNC